MRLWPLLLVSLLASHAAAQVPAATVSGVVHDSIARAPLAGAVVQLVATDSLSRIARSVVTDSLGRFAIDSVPNGRYTLGFLHPVLDSLGLEPPLRAVIVDGQGPVRADLAVPSPARLRAVICAGAADSGAVAVGVVRYARDRVPAAAVPVSAEWLEYAFTPLGIRRRIVHASASTAGNGWFALCNVPSVGTMSLFAGRGADSTGRIEVQIPTERFVRHDLYVGAAGNAGRLNGTVVAAVGGRPLAGARVSITGGPATRADARGEWTLADVPAGTRMLDVRVVGFYPERRAVDVVSDAAPVRVALATLQSVLDTVTVTATRLDRTMRDFEARRRGGMGRFLTPDDIARRNPFQTSDIFRTVAGVSVQGDEILMHPAFGGCAPTLYINGAPIPGGRPGVLTLDDIDIWAHPNEVAAIEIYTDAAPPQFQRALSGCGSIVMWTKPPPAYAGQASWKLRALLAAGIVAVLLVVGELIDRR